MCCVQVQWVVEASVGGEGGGSLGEMEEDQGEEGNKELETGSVQTRKSAYVQIRAE